MKSDALRVQHIESYLSESGLSNELQHYYDGRCVLVTGGAGAIGSNLVVALASLVGSNGRVVVLDNLSALESSRPVTLPALGNVLFVKGDVRCDEDLRRVFGEGPTIVFHLAAFFANQRSVDYPEAAVRVDIVGLVKVLQYSRLTGVARFIFASSEYASGGPAANSYEPGVHQTEHVVATEFTSPYQINKVVGEMYCNYFHEMYGLPTVVCRCFNSYGPGELPGQYRNVIPNFFYWAKRGLPLPITGNGRESRDFTYVLDLVQGFLRSAYCDKAIGEHFNLAASREIEILILAELVNEIVGSKAGIVFKSRRAWDAKPRSLASIDKAKSLIGFSPRTEFRDGLLATATWFDSDWSTIEQLATFPPGVSSAVRDASEVAGSELRPRSDGRPAPG